MAVKVIVSGADKGSDEYIAALKLKEIIQAGIPEHASGDIVLYASATLIGQAVKDVDIMMLGNISGYTEKLKVLDKDTGDYSVENVEIQSFCTTIEIKKHSISGIVLNGTDLYVKYGSDLHSVTLQSNRQRVSAMNFFKQSLNFSPYITSIIWFTQATNDEIKSLLTNEGKTMLSNALGSEYSFKELIQLISYQKPPYRYGSKYVFDSNYGDNAVYDYQKALDLFSRVKSQTGELTRQRIELLTADSFSPDKNVIRNNGLFSIYRGRAGTGKTVGLLQRAIQLVDEEDARVLMLTYNKALVSDIRRLLALAELPDMFQESCVHVDTMHSYFYKLANNVLYSSALAGDKFISEYDAILNELKAFLDEEDSAELVKEVMQYDDQLRWEYVMIDEAQDWTSVERDIVLKLFDSEKIVVADGGNQFVRNETSCDWSIVKEKNNYKLKQCLRQKQNLVSFLNAYTDKYGVLGGKITPSQKMVGGRVVITSDDYLEKILKDELEKCTSAGNSAYDMMLLAPHSLVSKESGESHFAGDRILENAGINYWDGVNSNNRSGYSINTDEVRVLLYESSRGLEGWTVVCLDFDEFINDKERDYKESGEDALLLESPKERKKKQIYNWAMLPLTRAIDTLIITIKDNNSDTAKLLREVASDCRDFVTWI